MSIAVPSRGYLLAGDYYTGVERWARERTITGKHVLSVSTVSKPPCFVCEGVDFSGAVIALVKGYGD